MLWALMLWALCWRGTCIELLSVTPQRDAYARDMCGRYTHLYTWKELHRLLSLNASVEFELGDRYNVAPSQLAPVVRAVESGRELAKMRWGLVPAWAKDVKIAYSTINARAEGLADKPAFRSAFKRRRCLVPVSGFYEWKAVPGAKVKQPYYITLADGEVMVFAGLWESWRDPTAPQDAPAIESFTIITTSANELMATIHDRMPVIVDAADFARWLDPANQETASIAGIMKPYSSELMLATPVSTLVNSPKNDNPKCIQSIDGQRFTLF